MTIASIKIRNFRSIRFFESDVQELNIFVGPNDEGKSNVLRALDLFFNDGKRRGIDLNWDVDYCAFAPARSRKAPEILIEIEVEPPSGFKLAERVRWRRAWRREGLNKDEISLADGRHLPRKTKIETFLRSIRFEYVPAIKSPEYFQDLMTSVHDMLEETVEAEVRSASGSFTKKINENTQPILEGVLDRLGLKSRIELPPNLRDIFSQLEFSSTSHGKVFSLSQRGDGVKVRHVPIILRWLAEQANHLSAPGKPKTRTIWGYEEPENNVEIGRCFELANDFLGDSGEIQKFITTHSPVIYSVVKSDDSDGSAIFSVTKDANPPVSSIEHVENNEISLLNESMGLFELLEPRVNELKKEVERLSFENDSVILKDRPVIFVEGVTDKTLFRKAMDRFYPDIANSVDIESSPHSGGGASWVKDMLVAWHRARHKNLAIGILDADDEGARVRKALGDEVTNRRRRNVAWERLEPGDEVKRCRSKGIRVPFAIEEVFPEFIWELAERQGWLQPRPNLLELYSFGARSVAFDDWLEGRLENSADVRLATMMFSRDGKMAVMRFIDDLVGSDLDSVLERFRPTLDKVVSKFNSP